MFITQPPVTFLSPSSSQQIQWNVHWLTIAVNPTDMWCLEFKASLHDQWHVPRVSFLPCKPKRCLLEFPFLSYIMMAVCNQESLKSWKLPCSLAQIGVLPTAEVSPAWLTTSSLETLTCSTKIPCSSRGACSVMNSVQHRWSPSRWIRTITLSPCTLSTSIGRMSLASKH